MVKDSALWIWALAAAVLMQTLCAFLTRLFPVVGPALTEAAGVPAEAIGYLAALNSLGTVWYLVAGGDLLAMLGPLRSMQLGTMVGVFGLLLALTGNWWMLLLASLLIGMRLWLHARRRQRGAERICARAAPLPGLFDQAIRRAAGRRDCRPRRARAARRGGLARCLRCLRAVRAGDDRAGRAPASRPRSRCRPRPALPAALLRGSPDAAHAVPVALRRVAHCSSSRLRSICFAIVQGSVLAFFVTYARRRARATASWRPAWPSRSCRSRAWWAGCSRAGWRIASDRAARS